MCYLSWELAKNIKFTDVKLFELVKYEWILHYIFY